MFYDATVGASTAFDQSNELWYENEIKSREFQSIGKGVHQPISILFFLNDYFNFDTCVLNCKSSCLTCVEYSDRKCPNKCLYTLQV